MSNTEDKKYEQLLTGKMSVLRFCQLVEEEQRGWWYVFSGLQTAHDETVRREASKLLVGMVRHLKAGKVTPHQLIKFGMDTEAARELEKLLKRTDEDVPYFARRSPSKAFAKLDASGKTGRGTDITQSISEGRGLTNKDVEKPRGARHQSLLRQVKRGLPLNKRQYENAMKRIEGLMDAKPGTPGGRELTRLARLVERYEEKICRGRDLAKSLGKTKLSRRQAAVWNRDLQASRKRVRRR